MQFLENIFSFKGRIGRVNFFWRIFLYFILVYFIFPIISMFFVYNRAPEWLSYLNVLIIVISVLAILSGVVKRMHDLNYSGLLGLPITIIWVLTFTPILGYYGTHYILKYLIIFVDWIFLGIVATPILVSLITATLFIILVLIKGEDVDNRYGPTLIK